mgnify:CR=1 FL=1
MVAPLQGSEGRKLTYHHQNGHSGVFENRPLTRLLQAINNKTELSMKFEIDKKEYERSEQIMALGKAHNKEDFAVSAIASGVSIDAFRSALLQQVANSEPLDLKTPMGAYGSQGFDFGKAFTQFVEGRNIDGLEGEFQQEMIRQRPLKSTSSFYVPTSTRALGSSAPLSSLNVQDVQRSGEQDAQWRQWGVSVYNIANGRARIPAETALASGQMVDFDGSNSASDVQPTLSGVDLEPTSAVAFCTVNRNLLNRESIDVNSYVGGSLLRSINFTIEDQILGGSGSSPNLQGVLNASVNQETYSSAPDFADIRNAIQHVMDDGYSTNNSAFVVTPAFFNSLQAISKDSGSGNFLLEPNNDGFIKGYMCGYPVYVSSKLSSGHIVFGDWSYYALGMFNGMEVIVDDKHDLQKGQYAVMAVADIAGKVTQPKAFTELLSA